MPTMLENAQAMIAALEAERRRVGEQIHDELCQSLTSLSLLVQHMRHAASLGESISPSIIDSIAQQVETAIKEARRVSRRFAPADLRGAGLLTAIQELVSQSPGVEFLCEKAVIVTNPAVALCIYRLSEEALYGAAEQGRRLTLSATDRAVELSIEPFAAACAEILALIEMRSRILGGAAAIAATQDGQSRLRCSLPLVPGVAADSSAIS